MYGDCESVVYEGHVDFVLGTVYDVSAILNLVQ